METSTRYIGLCPVCERQIKVRSGLLVHHGYERPGKGYIVGDCPGVGYEPYELGTGAADYYLRAYVIPEVRAAERTLQVLQSPEGPPYLTFEHYDVTTKRVVRDEQGNPDTIRLTRVQADDLAAQLPSWDRDRYDWERRLKIAVAQTESHLQFWHREQARMERLIAEWQPRPLTTVEEEVAKAAEVRAERTRQRQAEREQRMAEALVSLQQRIDSAVRNKRPDTIRDLFRDGMNKLMHLSGYTLERDDVLRLLERDHVWRAFGLIRPDGTYLADWREVSKAFEPWDSWRDQAPEAFPAELGGGRAKLRR